MKRRKLGRTGLEISGIGLGTVELGLDYHLPGTRGERPSAREAERILYGALDCGINFIDTARGYGTSEEVIGAVLADRRKEYVLASKVNAADVLESIGESLRALRTDWIDVMFLHQASLDVLRRGEAVEGLVRAREAGMIRYMGASTYGPDEAFAAIADGRFDCLQIAWNAARTATSATLDAAAAASQTSA